MRGSAPAPDTTAAPAGLPPDRRLTLGAAASIAAVRWLPAAAWVLIGSAAPGARAQFAEWAGPAHMWTAWLAFWGIALTVWDCWTLAAGGRPLRAASAGSQRRKR